SKGAWLLAATGVLCVVAIAVNPYGLAYWQALRPVGGGMFPHIDEWKPFWKPTALYHLAAGEAGLLLIAVVLWGLNPRRRWAHLAWLLVMAVLFVSARRHLWLLALVALAVATVNGRFLTSEPVWKAWRRRAQRDEARINAAPTAGLRCIARGGVLMLLAVCIAIATPSDFWPLRATSRYLPVKLASFIQHRPVRRLFNDYENSSYLHWRFAGRPPLFIDLLNAYPDSLLVDDYFDMIKANARGRRLLESRAVDCVTLRRHTPDESLAQLAKFLNHNARWKRIYEASDGTVWERHGRGKSDQGL
ncbi:MAG TPA: hypothetical protein VNA16_07450, partial [Abditibacteriaceae bacterium]|nr:hypothetical protein [Abditibacteriaceae bacterium]